MKEVWVVERWEQHESARVVAVFATRDRALLYVGGEGFAASDRHAADYDDPRTVFAEKPGRPPEYVQVTPFAVS